MINLGGHSGLDSAAIHIPVDIIEILKAQRRQTVSLCGTTFDQITESTADQANLLKHLQAATKGT